MKHTRKLLLIATSLFAASAAWSIPLSTVGGVDHLITQDKLKNSGDATELGWIERMLATSFDSYDKQDSVASDWVAVDDSPNTYALKLKNPQEFFMIKTGKNTGTSDTHFLFDNAGDPSWLVVNLGDMGFTGKSLSNIGKLSHLIGVGTVAPTNVPEPSTLALMALGLVGIVVATRRRRRS